MALVIGLSARIGCVSAPRGVRGVRGSAGATRDSPGTGVLSPSPATRTEIFGGGVDAPAPDPRAAISAISASVGCFWLELAALGRAATGGSIGASSVLSGVAASDAYFWAFRSGAGSSRAAVVAPVAASSGVVARTVALVTAGAPRVGRVATFPAFAVCRRWLPEPAGDTTVAAAIGARGAAGALASMRTALSVARVLAKGGISAALAVVARVVTFRV